MHGRRHPNDSGGAVFSLYSIKDIRTKKIKSFFSFKAQLLSDKCQIVITSICISLFLAHITCPRFQVSCPKAYRLCLWS